MPVFLFAQLSSEPSSEQGRSLFLGELGIGAESWSESAAEAGEAVAASLNSCSVQNTASRISVLTVKVPHGEGSLSVL